MKKYFLTLIFAAATAVLAFLLQQSNAQLRELQKQLSDVPPSMNMPKAETDSQPQSASPPPQPEIISAITEEPTPPEPQPEDIEKAERRRVMGNMAKMMMENPTMNKVMEASQRGALSALYVDMIDYLNLTPDETKYFMDLLMHRQMKHVEMAMQMMGGSLSPEERNALMEELKSVGIEFESEMEKFLNNAEDFDEFRFYEKTMGERMMLSQVDAELAGTDHALSDDVYQEMLEIMHEERNNFSFTDDLGDQQKIDFSEDRFSQENIDRYMEETLRLGQLIDERLMQILTPEQMQAYHKSGKAMLDMHFAQLQQARQMFGEQ